MAQQGEAEKKLVELASGRSWAAPTLAKRRDKAHSQWIRSKRHVLRETRGTSE